MFALFSAFVLAAQAMSTAQYRGEMLVELAPTQEQYAALVAEVPSFDVWTASPRGVVTARVAKADMAAVASTGARLVRVVAPDLSEYVAERLAESAQSRAEAADFLDTYRNSTEVRAKLEELAARFPDIVRVGVAGPSFEGRDIVFVSIGRQETAATELYLQGVAHAREHIAHMTVMWSVIALLEEYEAGDELAVATIENMVIHAIPVLNPDGLDYSFETDRLWRKNRSDYGTGFRGVDLNRNADVEHCGVGSSTNPRSDTYCGPSPNSEVELQTELAFLTAHPNIKCFLFYHSYGSLLLRPQQVSLTPTPDEAELARVGSIFADAAFAVNGERYDSILGAELYLHSGGAIDAAWRTFGQMAYTIELRGPGFIVPDSTIAVSGTEIHAALRALLEEGLAGRLGL